MHAEGFFFQAFVYLAAAVFSVPLAKRLGLGSVLGYLIAGMIIGPFGLSLVGEQGQDVMHFAEFGVVMMLFLVGLELEPALLWRMRSPILGLGGLQVGVTAAVIAGAIALTGFGPRESIALGLTLALSSTAIVLQTLNEKNLMKTVAGQNSFAVLLFQDIAVIPILAILPLLAAGDAHSIAGAEHGPGWVENLSPVLRTGVVLVAVAAIVVAGKFIVQPLLRFVARSKTRELFTAAALLLVIATALLMDQVGLSPALGTFLAGVVLANSEFRHELEGDIEPFKGLLLGLFFIAVGASIDFALITSEPSRIAILVAIIIGAKLPLLLVLARVFRMSTDQSILFGFALAQGGEFAFVLLSFATQNLVMTSEAAAPVTAAVAISMALSPVLMIVAERLLIPRVGTREASDREADAIHEENPVIIAGFGRFGHIVGRLLNASGIGNTVLDIDSDNVEVLRKLGLKVFYGDASRIDLLRSAGADKAKLLLLALDSPEKTLEIVETARKHFPNLQIMARANGRWDAYELLDHGVTDVYRETLDSSLRMGVDAMRHLGLRAYQAERAARKFRKHDEDYLRELAEMRHDRTRHLNVARQRIQDLEKTLRQDRQVDRERTESGWDIESLAREFQNRSDPVTEI